MEEDIVVWIDLRNDTFLVKSLYVALEPMSSIPFPTGVNWNPWFPSKVSFFEWEACWGKVLTLNQFWRRGQELAYCYLYKVEEESIDHIPPHYAKTRSLCLAFLRCCLPQVERIFKDSMTPLWEEDIRKFGELFLCAFFEQFEKREIKVHLRTRSNLTIF